MKTEVYCLKNIVVSYYIAAWFHYKSVGNYRKVSEQKTKNCSHHFMVHFLPPGMILQRHSVHTLQWQTTKRHVPFYLRANEWVMTTTLNLRLNHMSLTLSSSYIFHKLEHFQHFLSNHCDSYLTFLIKYKRLEHFIW